MTSFGHSFLRNRQLLRFLVAGAVNSIVGLSIYSGAILGGLPVWGALAVGNVAGIIFNFFSTGGYVFRSLLLAHFPRFLAAYLVVYAINFQLISILSRWLPNAIVAQAILTIPMALCSYLLMKKFVFVRNQEL